MAGGRRQSRQEIARSRLELPIAGYEPAGMPISPPRCGGKAWGRFNIGGVAQRRLRHAQSLSGTARHAWHGHTALPRLQRAAAVRCRRLRRTRVRNDDRGPRTVGRLSWIFWLCHRLRSSREPVGVRLSAPRHAHCAGRVMRRVVAPPADAGVAPSACDPPRAEPVGAAASTT